MSFNQNWVKWVEASIYKHFDDNKSSLAMYAEGDQRQRAEEKDRFEVRMTGPDIQQQGNNWRLDWIVDVLVISVSNENDLYSPAMSLGIVLQAFANMIPVYQYTNGDAFLACLQMMSDIRVTRFPDAADSTNPLQRTSVEATYRIHLEG